MPNPIAQNVVFMKVQYGIDTSAKNPNGTFDGSVDCWTPPRLPTSETAPSADSTGRPIPSSRQATAAAARRRADFLNRIVAVRIGLVVRSDEPDLRNPALYVPSSTTPDGVTGTRQATYLFNCATNTDAGCQNRVLVPAGAVSAMGKSDCATASASILCDGWRYRTYEAIVPLRNTIFNATIIP